MVWQLHKYSSNQITKKEPKSDALLSKFDWHDSSPIVLAIILLCNLKVFQKQLKHHLLAIHRGATPTKAPKAWALPKFCRIEGGGGTPLMWPPVWGPCLPKFGRGAPVHQWNIKRTISWEKNTEGKKVALHYIDQASFLFLLNSIQLFDWGGFHIKTFE